jgi:hypothetical protein
MGQLISSQIAEEFHGRTQPEFTQLFLIIHGFTLQSLFCRQ